MAKVFLLIHEVHLGPRLSVRFCPPRQCIVYPKKDRHVRMGMVLTDAKGAPMNWDLVLSFRGLGGGKVGVWLTLDPDRCVVIGAELAERELQPFVSGRQVSIKILARVLVFRPSR